MKFSAINPEDASQLLELWNRSASFDPLSARLLEEKVWGDCDFDQDLALVVRDEAPIAMGMAVVRKLATGRRGYLKLIAVAPERQRQGLGLQLAQKLQEALILGGVTEIRVGESAPNYLFPGVDTRYEHAAKLFESLGYQKIGEASNLVAPLSNQQFSTQTLEKEVVVDGVLIRRAARDDSPFLGELLSAHWPTWQAEVAKAMSNLPVSIHLALSRKQVVGFAAYDSNNLGTGWFGPMGTHPDFRGRGLGKTLLLRCLKDIHVQGHSQAIIPWVSTTSLYPSQVGATIDRTFTRYELTIH